MSIPHFTLIASAPRDSRQALCDWWKRAISTSLDEELQSHFTILEGRLRELDPSLLQCDCMVSPANSYGIMDGGYDLELSKSFVGPDHDTEALTRHAQLELKRKWHGYAPPTTCTIVHLPTVLYANVPWSTRYLAILPTMATPRDVQWHKDLVYNSMWSLLVQLAPYYESGEIKRVVMTGLGTGTGGVNVETCAKQMILAVKHFCQGLPEYPSWDEANRRAQEVDGTLGAM